MTKILFWFVIASALLSNGLLVFSIARPELRLWPLPAPSSRRYQLARVAGTLGPLGLIGILLLGVLDWDSFVWHHWTRFIVGATLLIPAGFFALWGYFGLGVRASEGKGGPLVVSGAYRYSRNPQYIGAVVAFLGCALISNSLLALVGWAFWSAWFVMAPFAEEPWLREHLGAAYDEYAKAVRRF